MSSRAALLSSLAAVAGLVVPVGAAAPTKGHFAALDHPMMLTRTVWRSLADGQQIKVERRFRIAITNDGTGFRVSGAQVGVAVDVPPQIALLAEVERQRDESNLFPLRLDAAGMLAAAPAHPASATAHDQAVAAARAVLSGKEAPGGDGLGFVAALAKAGAAAPWPTNLFNAAPGEATQQRAIALPDGSTGHVTVTLKVGPPLPCGLPAAVERAVVTQLGGTTRSSREQWSFERM